MSAPLSAAERLARLRLSRSENVGPVTFRHLLSRYGTAMAALEALPELARRGGRTKPLRIAGVAEAKRELERLEALGAGVVIVDEPDYPPVLAALDDAPPILTVQGARHLLARPTVAIVGARNASLNGRRFAETLARDLGAAGWVVVSGLARGIDGAAHQGALASGTIACVAGGVDVVYPPEHADLHAEIAARGAVVSEMPPGTQPTARHFPRRNRVIAGLSLGVVVVEAAEKSGSLITARLAGEQGREVMAVPGSPLDPRCKGTNGLIRDGAHLIEGAADVMAVLTPLLHRLKEPRQGDLFAHPPPPPPTPLDETGLAKARTLVLELLGPSPVLVDELIRECHLSSAFVSAVLLELELAGKLDRLPGNRVALAGAPPDDKSAGRGD